MLFRSRTSKLSGENLRRWTHPNNPGRIRLPFPTARSCYGNRISCTLCAADKLVTGETRKLSRSFSLLIKPPIFAPRRRSTPCKQWCSWDSTSCLVSAAQIDATSDHLKTPVNCPHCGQKSFGRGPLAASGLYPAILCYTLFPHTLALNGPTDAPCPPRVAGGVVDCPAAGGGSCAAHSRDSLACTFCRAALASSRRSCRS